MKTFLVGCRAFYRTFEFEIQRLILALIGVALLVMLILLLMSCVFPVQK